MLLPEIIARHIARHRDQQLALDNSRLRSDIVDLRGQNRSLADRAVRADRAADRAFEEAGEVIKSFSDGIRDAHAILIEENEQLRIAGYLAAADLIEHNVNGAGLDFADAEDAARHLRTMAEAAQQVRS